MVSLTLLGSRGVSNHRYISCHSSRVKFTSQQCTIVFYVEGFRGKDCCCHCKKQSGNVSGMKLSLLTLTHLAVQRCSPFKSEIAWFTVPEPARCRKVSAISLLGSVDPIASIVVVVVHFPGRKSLLVAEPFSVSGLHRNPKSIWSRANYLCTIEARSLTASPGYFLLHLLKVSQRI